MEKTLSRGWCYTVNNFTQEDENFAFSLSDCSVYTICGREIAPETGTMHLQGYVYFNTLKSLKQMKELHGTAHWEAARGSVAENKAYCSKDGDYFEAGDAPLSQVEKGEKGKEYWLKNIEHFANANWAEIDPELLVKNSNGLRYASKLLYPKTLEDTTEKMLWYYGAANTGKSRKAREDHPNAYLKKCNKWWCGYDDQETVLIEDLDIRDANTMVHHLKIWGDRYPFPAEIKGGKIDIRPKLIIVTSNYHPSDLWTDERDLAPIMRRFNCIEFGKHAFNPYISSAYVNTFNKLN